MKLRKYKSLLNSGLSYIHWCPGCNAPHCINVEKKNEFGCKFAFNGDLEKPSFFPPVNIGGVCHYHIHDGHIRFLDDSTHRLKGQMVPLPELPEEYAVARVRP